MSERRWINRAPDAVPGPPIEIALVGLGAIGQAVAAAARARRSVRLGAAIDVDPAKLEQDLGVILGQDPWGSQVRPTPLDRPSGAPAAVAVHTTGSFLEEVAPQILGLIERGYHVVSSAEELAYPWLKHPEIAARIDAAARERNLAVVGMGVNPGFAMDALPAMLSSIALDIQAVRVVRVVNTSHRRLNLQRKTGAGMTVREFDQALAGGKMGHIGLAESCGLLALALGWRVEAIRDEIAPIVADRDLASEHLEVPCGRVAGLHQVASGIVAGQTVVELDLTMALGGVEDRDQIQLRGTPDLTVVVPGGLPGDVATVAALLNAVPAIVRARPGLRTVLDLPRVNLGR